MADRSDDCKGIFMKVKTITMWYSLEETKNRIPDMQLCGELMRNDIVGEAKGSEKIYGFGHIGTNEKLFVFYFGIYFSVLILRQFRKEYGNQLYFPGRIE